MRAVTFSSMYASVTNGLPASITARAYAGVCNKPGTSAGANSAILVAVLSSSTTSAK